MIRRCLIAGIMALKLASPSNIEELENEMEIVQYDIDDQTLSERISGFLSSILKIEDNEPEEVDIAEDTNYERLPMLLATTKKAENTYKNVVVYKGRFDNTECRLIIPYNQFSNLSVIDGVLTNIGNSSVTGRLLYGDDEIDVNVYDTYSYILNPVYNSPQSVYRYGSYNYQRHYYVGNTGISYSDLYGKFYVDDWDLYYSDSQRTYYGILAIIFLLGITCIRSKK